MHAAIDMDDEFLSRASSHCLACCIPPVDRLLLSAHHCLQPPSQAVHHPTFFTSSSPSSPPRRRHRILGIYFAVRLDLAIPLPNTPRPREGAPPTQARSRCQTFQLMSQLDRPPLSDTLPTHSLPEAKANPPRPVCAPLRDLPIPSTLVFVIVVPTACLPVISAPLARSSRPSPSPFPQQPAWSVRYSTSQVACRPSLDHAKS